MITRLFDGREVINRTDMLIATAIGILNEIDLDLRVMRIIGLAIPLTRPVGNRRIGDSGSHQPGGYQNRDCNHCTHGHPLSISRPDNPASGLTNS